MRCSSSSSRCWSTLAIREKPNQARQRPAGPALRGLREGPRPTEKLAPRGVATRQTDRRRAKRMSAFAFAAKRVRSQMRQGWRNPNEALEAPLPPLAPTWEGPAFPSSLGGGLSAVAGEDRSRSASALEQVARIGKRGRPGSLRRPSKCPRFPRSLDGLVDGRTVGLSARDPRSKHAQSSNRIPLTSPHARSTAFNDTPAVPGPTCSCMCPFVHPILRESNRVRIGRCSYTAPFDAGDVVGKTRSAGGIR